MKSILSILALLGVALASASAGPTTFDFKDPKGVNNAVFQLDAPLESINGTASGIAGTVTLDPENPTEISGTIEIDTVSMEVPNPLMKEHLHGADWMHVEAHPKITFEVKSIANQKKEGNTGTADVTGVFTMKGISKEITVPVKVTYLPGKLADRTGGKMEGDLLVIRTNFSLSRGDFGIKAGEATDKVAEEIAISLAIAGAAPKS